MNLTISTFDNEPPSNLAIFRGMVSSTADEDGLGATQTVTIRMPLFIASTFDALASHSGKSRNKLLVKALEVALDEVWQSLPAEELKTIEKIRGEAIHQRLVEYQANHQGEVTNG